jgi:glycosyltransferase involved in cell wall biosynthesis
MPDEVVVVDDGGNDGCDVCCAEFQRHSPLDLHCIYTDNPGQTMCSHARNVGLAATDAELVITSEPELLFDTDVIAQMLALRESRPKQILSAGTIHHVQENGTIETHRGWMATYCAMYERAWLADVGGWDEDFPDPWGWDDTDLLTRLRLTGVGQTVDPAMECTHQWHAPGWHGFEQTANEQHFLDKNLDQGGPDNPAIVANRDRVVGRPKERT